MGDVPELILDRERLEFVMLHIIPNTFVGNSLSQRLEVSISLEYGERTVEFRGLTMREALDAARMFISNQQEGKEES